MPSYDYVCPANGRTVEVRHPMSVRLRTWGELCEWLGIEAGGAPVDAPVEKLLGNGGVVRSANLGSGTAPAPHRHSGGCCGGGPCGMS